MDKTTIVEALKCMPGLARRSSDSGSPNRTIKVLMAIREDLRIRHTIFPMHIHQALGHNVHKDLELYIRMKIQTRILSQKIKLRNTSLATNVENTLIERAGT